VGSQKLFVPAVTPLHFYTITLIVYKTGKQPSYAVKTRPSHFCNCVILICEPNIGIMIQLEYCTFAIFQYVSHITSIDYTDVPFRIIYP